MDKQKWEYCMLYQYAKVRGRGFWLLKDGERIDLPQEESIVVVLNQLGKDGWEAVNFSDASMTMSSIVRNISQVGAGNQVLLKRRLG